MAKSTEKRKKMGLFQRFFHAFLSTFPPFPTFSAFANFYNRKCVLSVYCLRSPSRIPYRTELIPRSPKGRRTRSHPRTLQLCNRYFSNKHTLPARSLSRSPSSSPPPFTQYPSPPRSLVRDGPTSSHWPRLVVSCSTCPPLSTPPPRTAL